ncbi:MAG TPA: rhodanese-like domain-containing protein [Thermodesulfobacteriota bacterium]|nr:rhodanese-like domain-containing protein [Thermodesulfobacteriota bacterium]
MNRSKSLILAFAIIAVIMAALWVTNRAVTPKEAAWEDVLAEARQGGYKIIKTQDLWTSYQKDPNRLLLVDTRQDWEYRTGHIKGAVNFPIEPTWWSRWKKEKPLEALLGPDNNRFIVFY